MENTSIIELITIAHGLPWRPWAVWYFFLIGTSVGAFFLWLYMSRVRENSATSGVALFIAATSAVAANAALLADLHQPARFLHFYLSASPDSVMWWGSWFLPAYVGGVVLLGLRALWRADAGAGTGLDKALGIWCALFAVAVLGYTGLESAVVKARLVWNGPFLPVLLAISAVASGAGLTSVIAGIRGDAGRETARLWMTTALAAFFVIFITWLGLGMIGASVNSAALSELALQYQPVAVLGGVAIFGAAVPAMLGLLKNRQAAIASGALAVFGAFLFRWEMIIDVQRMVKTETAFEPFAGFLVGDSLEALLGSLGVWVLVALAGLVAIDWRSGKPSPVAE